MSDTMTYKELKDLLEQNKDKTSFDWQGNVTTDVPGLKENLEEMVAPEYRHRGIANVLVYLSSIT